MMVRRAQHPEVGDQQAKRSPPKKGAAHQQQQQRTTARPPLYSSAAAAAEPLLIDTLIVVRKPSRATSEQMVAVGNLHQQQKPELGGGGDSMAGKAGKDNGGGKDDCGKEKGILQSIRSYPTGVFFMLGNEFCERFSFYGMRAILIIYLTTGHHLTENTAKVIYHTFVSLSYFTPLFGSILADNYFGRFRVILWVSLVYVFGHVLLSVGAVPHLGELSRKILDYMGLAVIAIATGGIKPCVSAFAADQFPEDMHRERTQFFSFFYFAINAGSLIAIAVTPILRTVKCMDEEHCFPLAFGVPGALMMVAFVTFLLGTRHYKITPASRGNVIWKVLNCIGCALRRKINSKIGRGSRRRPRPGSQNQGGQQQSSPHWLDFAGPDYDEHLIAGVKSMLSVLVLFLPLIFFWALYDQQGSTWVLQARRMDGRVGPFTILPDQMNTINPLLILILVPIFEAWFYPFMSKICNLTPLRKIGIGGILAAVAFCIAGFVQIKVSESMEPKPAEGESFVFCLGNSSVHRFGVKGRPDIEIGNGKNGIPTGNYTFDLGEGIFLPLASQPPRGYVLGVYQMADGIKTVKFPYNYEKTEDGKTRFYLMTLNSSGPLNMEVYVLNSDNEIVSTTNLTERNNFVDVQPGFFSSSLEYRIAFSRDCRPIGASVGSRVDCVHSRKVKAKMGASYVLDLLSDPPLMEAEAKMVQLVRPNTVSILWQIPQIFVITIGEILFSVTGLEFSYSQAAPSMKSVLQAFWLLIVFFGNVFDIIIAKAEIPDPVAELFIYAGLMFVVIGIFILLALRYKYVDEHDLEIQESDKSSQNSARFGPAGEHSQLHFPGKDENC